MPPRLDRFFELRFESIGGLGAHGAGQVLATAAVLRMGLNGAQFSSYGSEKKGSLVRTYVRLGPADRPVRTSAPIDAPDGIVVFHAALADRPSTFGGLKRDGFAIINAPSGALANGQLALLPRTAHVLRVDALGIAVAESSRPNAALLGALCAAVPFLDADTVSAALAEEFAGKHPEAVASNERAFRRGAVEYEQLDGVGRAEGDLPVFKPEPVWGYATQPPGGVIHEAGNTAWNDLSISRTGWMPVLHAEACIHCGTCDLVCPDLCLVWAAGDAAGADSIDAAPKYERRLTGIDYRYCKGCMRCVESCPTGALVREPETPGLASRLRVPHFPGLIA